MYAKYYRIRYEELQDHVQNILPELDEGEEHFDLEDDSNAGNDDSSNPNDIGAGGLIGINTEESYAESELIIEEDDIRNDEQEEGATFEADFEDDFDSGEPPIPQRHDALIAKDQTAWLKNFPSQAVRVSSHNVFRGTVVGPTRATQGLIECDVFELIFTPSMLQQILVDTNEKARKAYEIWNEKNCTGDKRIWEKLTLIELRAFIGLVLLAGVNKSNDEDVDVLWGQECICFYRAVMPKSRFKEIVRFIRFDSERTRAVRLEANKAAPISELWTQMNANLRKYYQPSGEITADEQLFAYRGRTRFTQYIPSKPAKYGIKVWFACDAKSFYPLKSEIYTGKNSNAGRANNVGEGVVQRLVCHWENTGRTIICDNFFTSLNLGKYLMSKGLAILGTVRQNKTFVPYEMKADRNRAEESFIFGFLDGKFSLVSYVQKRGISVIILASTPLTNSIVAEKKNKPQYILDYDVNKGGVDAMDKMLSAYSTKRKTLRRPLAMFYNMLDISSLASFIIYSENNPYNRRTDVRRKFLRSLSKQLFMPAIEQRSQVPRVLGFHQTRKAIEIALDRSLSATSNVDSSIYLIFPTINNQNILYLVNTVK
ncbi:piggyBac transposable element-derived protein 1-like [Anastrepha ludens]|uniref:piggyBac transposable element-derived protein 1-like n=1 Tax=Anastrepha ludens TaxID=28586 RepID=UPI0023B05423|nr:piggyBac transposable element-derived protein 1-like [Anastrepha ludens]